MFPGRSARVCRTAYWEPASVVLQVVGAGTSFDGAPTTGVHDEFLDPGLNQAVERVTQRDGGGMVPNASVERLVFLQHEKEPKTENTLTWATYCYGAFPVVGMEERVDETRWSCAPMTRVAERQNNGDIEQPNETAIYRRMVRTARRISAEPRCEAQRKTGVTSWQPALMASQAAQ